MQYITYASYTEPLEHTSPLTSSQELKAPRPRLPRWGPALQREPQPSTRTPTIFASAFAVIPTLLPQTLGFTTDKACPAA